MVNPGGVTWMDGDHDLLLRVDERVAALGQEMRKMNQALENLRTTVVVTAGELGRLEEWKSGIHRETMMRSSLISSAIAGLGVVAAFLGLRR